MDTVNQTAILVFSRFATEEAKEKKYINSIGKKRGVDIAQQLISYTIAEARRSEIPVHTFFSDQQAGTTFGERLANAFEVIFNRGVETVMVVGTDSPSITAGFLKRVSEKIVQGKLVVGPSADGGVYMMGLNKIDFSREHFIQIPWLTDKVFIGFEKYASDLSLAVQVEETGVDIDNMTDLFEWLKLYLNHRLCRVIKTILNFTKQIRTAEIGTHFQNSFSLNFKLRGPPAFI